MKAPDKIYIPLYPNHSLDGVRLGDDYMYEPHKECDNVEYIRKDALLEWVKACYKATENDNLLSDIFKQGALYELHRVILKIESL